MLGKKAKDKVTGLEGIITGRANYIYGCDQLLLMPTSTDGKAAEGAWFDVGRVEVIGEGISPESVRADKPGGPSQGPRRY